MCMESRYIPVDGGAIGKVELRAVFPKSVFKDGQITGEQETDKDGLLKWKLVVHFVDERSLNGINGGRSGEQSGVTVASKVRPLDGVERGERIELEDLVYMAWVGNDGQPHEALRASSVSAVK